MRKLLIILSILVFGVHIQAQNKYPAEHSNILSDRAFFVSGEEIQFSGNITIDSVENILSSIVYIELIDPLGNKINQQKYYLNGGNSFEGRIIIPESTISGYYFLRAYTNWMKNAGSDSFDQLMLKIVNPFILDLQSLPDSLRLEKEAYAPYNDLRGVSLNTVYHEQEAINMNLKDIDVEDVDLIQVSVVPEGSQQFPETTIKPSVNYIDSVKYFPETRGLSLNGSVLLNGEKSAYHLVNLNVIGEKDFLSVFADSLGKFHFPLPKKYGIQELMIGAQEKAGDIQVLVDNDYESGSYSGKVFDFVLSKTEEKLALQLAKQYQINKWYYDSISEESKKKNSIPFYRNPFKTIDFDYYILLDSVSQYFTDISSYVLVKKKHGHRYLQIMGEESGFMVHEPLLLVDWIPINNAERIFAMNPANIKKIEVVNKMYYHGNKTYGGIIHVRTREGNMADLKFPESNIYLNFQFPEQKIMDENLLQFPGTAFNKIYSKDEISPISIPSPKLPGRYILMIQSLDKDGNKQRFALPFEVTD